MLKHLVLILVLFPCIGVSQDNNNPIKLDSVLDIKDKKFIVIANVGASDFSVAPIIISCDSIKGDLYKKGNYSQHLKFNGYSNYVIDSASYRAFLNYLNIYKSYKKRDLNFVKTEKNIAIIDFRDGKNQDFELFSLTEVSTTVYFIRNLYCFFNSNGYDKKLISHLEFMYSGLLKYYDREGKIYESTLTCK